MQKADFAALRKRLKKPQRIVIFGHRNPDGDALGSTLGLMYYLKQYWHDITILYPSEYPSIYSWMPGLDQVVISDLDEDRACRIIAEAQMAFCLDFSALSRIDKMGEQLSTRDIPKVVIDHHLDPEDFADYLWWDTGASSTCEMVYKFISQLGDKDKIDHPTGECLFTGMITDTGSFNHNTNPDLYRICAELKARGIDDQLIQQRLNQNFEEKQLRVLGHALAHRMRILRKYRTGIIYLSRRDFAHFDIQRGDTEGIVNRLLSIKDVRLAVFITQQPNIVKLSFRSKGAFSVQEIASKYFNGGGHRNAAGGYMHASLKAVLDKVRSILPEYQKQLNDDSLFPQ